MFLPLPVPLNLSCNFKLDSYVSCIFIDKGTSNDSTCEGSTDSSSSMQSHGVKYVNLGEEDQMVSSQFEFTYLCD